MKAFLPKIILLLTTLVLCFGVGEVVVRNMGEVDTAGNFVFRNRIIRPHNLPTAQVAESLRKLQSSDDSIVVYDQYAGWVPRPGAVSQDGLYHFNSQGIRSPVAAYPARPDSGVLRIALFGDSFTHGDDVPYEDSFGAQLEAGLDAAGIQAEVLNFGVGGYGMDQAMLRFTLLGKNFAPHLVVFGFQPENLKRNLNLLRPLYSPLTKLPFAKPRFIFDDTGIRLINVPVLPPERLVETLDNLDTWDLLPHEHFYEPAMYQGAWWRHSRLLATVVDVKFSQDNSWYFKRLLYRDDTEEQRLGWAVIEVFAREITQTGAEFMIVHLPTGVEFNVKRQLGRWPYQTFLDALDDQYMVVHPEDRLMRVMEEAGPSAIFKGHYTARGNQIIAESLQTAITKLETHLIDQ